MRCELFLLALGRRECPGPEQHDASHGMYRRRPCGHVKALRLVLKSGSAGDYTNIVRMLLEVGARVVFLLVFPFNSTA